MASISIGFTSNRRKRNCYELDFCRLWVRRTTIIIL